MEVYTRTVLQVQDKGKRGSALRSVVSPPSCTFISGRPSARHEVQGLGDCELLFRYVLERRKEAKYFFARRTFF